MQTFKLRHYAPSLHQLSRARHWRFPNHAPISVTRLLPGRACVALTIHCARRGEGE